MKLTYFSIALLALLFTITSCDKDNNQIVEEDLNGFDIQYDLFAPIPADQLDEAHAKMMAEAEKVGLETWTKKANKKLGLTEENGVMRKGPKPTKRADYYDAIFETTNSTDYHWIYLRTQQSGAFTLMGIINTAQLVVGMPVYTYSCGSAWSDWGNTQSTAGTCGALSVSYVKNSSTYIDTDIFKWKDGQNAKYRIKNGGSPGTNEWGVLNLTCEGIGNNPYCGIQ